MAHAVTRQSLPAVRSVPTSVTVTAISTSGFGPKVSPYPNTWHTCAKACKGHVRSGL